MEYRNSFNDPKNQGPRYDKLSDIYHKHMFEVHLGIWNKWGFLSVVVIMGALVILAKIFNS